MRETREMREMREINHNSKLIILYKISNYLYKIVIIIYINIYYIVYQKYTYTHILSQLDKYRQTYKYD